MVKNEKEEKYKVTFYYPGYDTPILCPQWSVICNQMDMLNYVSRQEIDNKWILKVEEIKQ